jgi:hypothetical protein
MNILPQLLLVVLCLLSMGITIEKHGKPREGNENAWFSFISLIIQFVILWWGGFWDILIK